MSVRDTSREAYQKPGRAHAQQNHAARVMDYVRWSPRRSRDDLADDLDIRLASICSVVNQLIKEKALMDWRTDTNPRTGNSVHVIEIYDENDQPPTQPGLFHGEHDLT